MKATDPSAIDLSSTATATIDRRDFLRGAAALAVTAAIAGPSLAHADSPASEAHAATAAPVVHSVLAFSTGGALVSPAALASGTAALGAANAVATVTIHGHFVPAKAATALRVVKAHYAVPANGRIVDTPMYAWAAPAIGKGKDTTVKVPVAPGGGVLLSVEIGSPRTAEDSYFLTPGTTAGAPKLIAGTYAIAAGNPNLSGCRLTQTSGVPALTRATTSGPIPVDFEYVLVTIA